MRSSTLIMAAFLMTGALLGVNADDAGDARVSPDDLGFDRSLAEEQGSEERGEALEGAFFYLSAWLTEVSVWSHENPGLAKVFLVNAPWIVIGAFVARQVARASLIAYVLLKERKMRGAEP